MPIVNTRPAPITHTFVDDGNIPNNSLPLILYRGAIDLTGSPDPELIIEKTFAANGWGGMWRNGVYPYAHYHSMIHEVMGIARGRVKVLFGGDNGEAIGLTAGDVVILPAGTGPSAPRPRVPILWLSAPIRRAANTTFAAAARPSTPRRCLHPESAAARHGSGVRSGGSADDFVAGMITDWLAFWDSPHSIYVNARHKDVHYRLIAKEIAALVPEPQARVLDYGSGEALHADIVAAAAGELLLCEAAPGMRDGLQRRFAEQSENSRGRAARDCATAGAHARSHRDALGRAIPHPHRNRRPVRAVSPAC